MAKSTRRGFIKTLAAGAGASAIPRQRKRSLITMSDSLDMAEAVETRTPEEVQDEKDAQKEDRRKIKLHERLMKDYAGAEEYWSEQAAREEVDLKFYRALDITDQWQEFALRQRGYLRDAGDDTTPQKPCLMINQVDAPVKQIVNEAKQTRFSMVVKSRGKKAEAQLRQGLIRAREVDSDASTARFAALERAIICGRGFYRVVKEYANDGDFDQDLSYAEIPDQSCVLMDPSSTRRDNADASFVFIRDELSHAEFRRKFGKAAMPTHHDDDFEGSATGSTWLTENGVRIAECFYVDMETRHLIVDEATGQKKLVKRLPKGYDGDSREVEKRTVKWCLLSSRSILAEAEWEGRYLPVMSVIGTKHVIAGKVAFKGVVADAKDPNRIFNYMTSAEVEAIALSNKGTPMVDPRAIEGFERIWLQRNIRNWPYLPVRAVVDGQKIDYPAWNNQEPPIQAITMAIREAQANIQAVTGRHAPSLGQSDKQRSGIATKELKLQGEITSAHYMDAMSTYTIPHEGRVVNDMLYYLYDTPGRNARLVGDEGDEDEDILLNTPFYQTEDGPMEARGTRPPTPGAKPKLYALTKEGEYQIVCAMGKNLQTQKEENQELVRAMIESAPDLAMWLMDIYAETLEGPIASKIAKRIRKMNPQIAAAEAEEDDGPEATQAKLQTAEQQLQQLQQQMQEMQMALEIDAKKAEAHAQVEMAKIQATAQTKREELAGKERMATAQRAMDFGILKAKAVTEDEATRLQAEFDKAEQEAEHDHKVAMALLEHKLETERLELEAEVTAEQTKQQARLGIGSDLVKEHGEHSHQRDMAERTQSHERGMTAQTQSHERTMAERSAQHEDRMAARAEQHAAKTTDKTIAKDLTLAKEKTKAAAVKTKPKGKA
jgi:hypothetical protein